MSPYGSRRTGFRRSRFAYVPPGRRREQMAQLPRLHSRSVKIVVDVLPPQPDGAPALWSRRDCYLSGQFASINEVIDTVKRQAEEPCGDWNGDPVARRILHG